ncbi:MAG: U32 family peptidase, partial [Desulfobacterales bacterium]
RLSEIKRIVTEGNSQMEFEVFAVNDGCFFEEGFCQTTHALGGPLCLTDWEVQAPGGSLAAPELAQGLEELREYLWYQNNCGSTFQEEGLPNGPCSLCWFAHFKAWGVTAVKIVGREASFYRKMRSLQLVKAVMDKVREGVSYAGVSQWTRSLRGTPDYCDKGYMCYFREP